MEALMGRRVWGLWYEGLEQSLARKICIEKIVFFATLQTS